MSHGMSDDEIKSKLTKIILDNSFYEGEIKDDYDLFSDLDFESLSFSALIIELEEAFNISISKDDVENGMNTPNKIYELIQRKRIDV